MCNIDVIEFQIFVTHSQRNGMTESPMFFRKKAHIAPLYTNVRKQARWTDSSISPPQLSNRISNEPHCSTTLFLSFFMRYILVARHPLGTYWHPIGVGQEWTDWWTGGQAREGLVVRDVNKRSDSYLLNVRVSSYIYKTPSQGCCVRLLYCSTEGYCKNAHYHGQKC